MVYGKRFFHTQIYQASRQWLGKLQQFVLPPCCVACGATSYQSTPVVKRTLDLCAACQAQLPTNLHACQHCGLPLTGTQAPLICGRCLRRPPPYQASFCAYEYAYPIEHLIRRLKYHHALMHAQVLGYLLAEYLRDRHVGPWPECFIPMPLHPVRYRARGYNQVIELGRFLERELKITMRTDLVERIRYTPEQAGLSRRERRKNLRRAFSVTATTTPKHIALLDDVITTGSTVNELAQSLKRAGVEHIEVWGLARAAMRNGIEVPTGYS
ncbi:MAG: ComF family protein [Steroidobacteraceae bacterium]